MKLKGVLPALVTPLRADESLNDRALEALIEHLLKEGAAGFYVGGATGEGLALRRDVREELAARAVAITAKRAPVIVHIASMDFSEALALAAQAEACGADAVSAVPPLYFTYGREEIYQYYKALAAASSLPLIVYNTPAAGVRLSAEETARLFEIDNVAGVKWTWPSYDQVIRLKDLTHGEMLVVNGPDETLLMGLAAGADAAIGTTYNVVLPWAKAVYDAFTRGDLAAAQKAQATLTRFISRFEGEPTIPAVKAYLRAKGFAVGEAAFPQKRLSAAETAALVARLDGALA